MPMSRDDHEALLNELAGGEVPEQRKFEILALLRTDNVNDHEHFEKTNARLDRYKKDNEDLVVANSQLFRLQGQIEKDKENQSQQQEQTFSETVTIDSLITD